jgi:predicted HTH transcriptional regulator
MKKYKIFVSGVQKELKEERYSVKTLIEDNYLLKEYFDVFLFEDLPAKSKSSEEIFVKQVIQSDIYIGLLGNQYGIIGKDNKSATEKEYRQAKKSGKPILIFIKGNEDSKRDKKLQEFISEIKHSEHGHCYERFTSPVDLKTVLFNSLVDFLKDEGVISNNVFDESVRKDVSLSDIDEDKVKWFLTMAKIKRKYPLDINTPVKDVLTHLNLIKDEKPVNAAILLFGKNPQKFHLQAEIKCIQFPGIQVEKPFSSYHIYTGTLFDQIDKSVAFVLDAIKFPVVQQEHTVQVKRQHEIPLYVIQEAIVNAIAHRDYNNNSAVQVMLFVDRLEIWNSGKLSPLITIEQLKKPHTSHPGNPLIANAFYLTDYIQKAGSGTLEMMKQCKVQGLPEPEFVSIRNVEFRTILARDVFTEDSLMKIGLNERQINAVKYVKEKGKITNKEYQENFGLRKRQASDDLKCLETKKIFSKIGTTGRGTHYILRGANGAKGALKGR